MIPILAIRSCECEPSRCFCWVPEYVPTPAGSSICPWNWCCWIWALGPPGLPESFGLTIESSQTGAPVSALLSALVVGHQIPPGNMHSTRKLSGKFSGGLSYSRNDPKCLTLLCLLEILYIWCVPLRTRLLKETSFHSYILIQTRSLIPNNQAYPPPIICMEKKCKSINFQCSRIWVDVTFRVFKNLLVQNFANSW